MTNKQVLQFSDEGNLDHEGDARDAALVLVLPRPEEGAPSSMREPCSSKRALLRAAILMCSRASSLATSAERR